MEKVIGYGAGDLIVGRGICEKAGKTLRSLIPEAEKVMLVTDENVFSIYSELIDRTFFDMNMSFFVLPAGEEAKSASNYIALLEAMASAGLTRSDLLVVAGGGVPGDLGGFAAATYMRGIRYVQIPTTLLSMIDSSVGGKTAIDLSSGKNLAGAFYMPSCVLTDPGFLLTLPEAEYKNGLGEVLKYAVLCDVKLFDRLEKEGRNAVDDDLIVACIKHKLAYVKEDPTDKGVRKYLNLGHTVGHAIEKKSGYTVPHGVAVAQGIERIMRAGVSAGITDKEDYDRFLSVFSLLGFEKTTYEIDALLPYMKIDKKMNQGKLTLVIPKTIGKCVFIAKETEKLSTIFGD